MLNKAFSHLTLQEYLTAQYISQKDSRIQELVTKCLSERRWREVFLLVAGLKDDAGELLKLMETATQQYINTPKLQNLLAWVKRVTDTTTGDIQPVGKRAMAIAYADYIVHFAKGNIPARSALALTLIHNNVIPNAINIAIIANAIPKPIAITYAKAIAKIADAYTTFRSLGISRQYDGNHAIASSIDDFIDYTRCSGKFQIYRDVNYSQLIATLEKFKQQIGEIPDEREPGAGEVRQAFGKQIIQIWLKAFHITPKMLDLSESEMKALYNYFNANLLMVQCKEAAMRVSRETWEGIESRMLLPVREVERKTKWWQRIFS